MSAASEPGRRFGEVRSDLLAAGFHLDWMEEGPVRGEPMFAAFAHPDGRRVRFSHDLLTGETLLQQVAAPPHPEAVAFPALPVETRRQVLRWWMARRTALTGRVEAILGAALADADAETRVTALLCALRLRAFPLAEAVRGAAIPQNTADGAFPGDRLLYRRFQQVAVEALSGRGDRASALFATLANPVERPEALLLHALCTPLPDVPPPDDRLPDGVVIEDATLRLRGLGSELVWIPAIPHWRGGFRPADSDDPHPRQECPPAPCFVTKHVLTAAEVSWFGLASEDGLVAASEVPVIAGAAMTLGPGVALPDPATWSMAQHGPDGRLFPWGNTLVPAQPAGPWGVQWAEPPEWVCNHGAPALRAVQRRPFTARGAVRLMVSGVG